MEEFMQKSFCGFCEKNLPKENVLTVQKKCCGFLICFDCYDLFRINNFPCLCEISDNKEYEQYVKDKNEIFKD